VSTAIGVCEFSLYVLLVGSVLYIWLVSKMGRKALNMMDFTDLVKSIAQKPSPFEAAVLTTLILCGTWNVSSIAVAQPQVT